MISKEERQSLEIEKLRREVNKLGLEAALLSRNARTQILTTLISSVTTLVAVGGLLLSLYSLDTQNKRSAEYRRADDFAVLVRTV
jgi:predicted tellurium resistance membrane protein TerC